MPRPVLAPQLFTRHRQLAYAIARDYRVPGAECQDVEQEGLIALWIAARSFDPGKGLSFRTFAGYVIRRRLASVLKAALAKKHEPLTLSVREVRNDEGEWVSATDALAGANGTEEIVAARETLERMAKALGTLTELERNAWLMIANGEPYVTSPRTRESKRQENAATRARGKIRKHMELA